MGFIQQSTTKKIYAYLTQFAREKILNGDEVDFTVKYFSLHDSDVNYKISSNLVNNSYNALPSGFIPDITGDNQGCLFSIANGIELNNSLGGFVQPPQPVSLIGTVEGSCIIDDTKFEINVINIQGGTNQGFYWYVKTDVISFPTATSPIEDAIILSSTVSNNYTVGTPQSFNATFNFTDTYLPREADSYNFTVYAGDSSGIEVEIQKFTDINCSKRTYGWVQYTQDINSDYQALNLITPQQLNSNGGIPYISNNKYGFALFVIDNGNRRKDLNITDEDLSIDNPSELYYVFNDYLILENIYIQNNKPWNVDADKQVVRIPFNDTRDVESVTGEHSESVLINGVIARSQTESWQDYTQDSLVPSLIYNNSLQPYVWYTGNFDALHPTVKPFSNMVLDGFKISYVEIAPKYDPDNVPSWPPTGPVGTASYQYTSAKYKITQNGFPNPNVVLNPPEIGGSFVASGGISEELDFSWSILWPN